MTRWAIRYDDVSTLYEVHVEGCRHLSRRRFAGSLAVLDSVSGSEAAARFEESNEGCVTRLAPCAEG